MERPERSHRSEATGRVAERGRPTLTRGEGPPLAGVQSPTKEGAVRAALPPSEARTKTNPAPADEGGGGVLSGLPMTLTRFRTLHTTATLRRAHRPAAAPAGAPRTRFTLKPWPSQTTTTTRRQPPEWSDRGAHPLSQWGCGPVTGVLARDTQAPTSCAERWPRDRQQRSRAENQISPSQCGTLDRSHTAARHPHQARRAPLPRCPPRSWCSWWPPARSAARSPGRPRPHPCRSPTHADELWRGGSQLSRSFSSRPATVPDRRPDTA